MINSMMFVVWTVRKVHATTTVIPQRSRFTVEDRRCEGGGRWWGVHPVECEFELREKGRSSIGTFLIGLEQNAYDMKQFLPSIQTSTHRVIQLSEAEASTKALLATMAFE